VDILTRLGLEHTDDATSVTAMRAHLSNLETGPESIEPAT
jgi:hypothetical protein